MPVWLEQKVVSGRGEGREGTGACHGGSGGLQGSGLEKRRVVIPCPDVQAPVLSWWGEKRCQVLQRRGWAAGAPAPLTPPPPGLLPLHPLSGRQLQAEKRKW